MIFHVRVKCFGFDPVHHNPMNADCGVDKFGDSIAQRMELYRESEKCGIDIHCAPTDFHP